MRFLDDAKRRAADLSRNGHSSDTPTPAPADRLEPELTPDHGSPAQPPDPDVLRMADTFEALYSPPGGPTEDSAGWTENDNVFAEMGQDLNFARAASRDAFLKQDLTADSITEAPAAPGDGARPAQSSKTSIEMAFERRREAETSARKAEARNEWTPLRKANEESHGRVEPKLSHWPNRQADDAELRVSEPEPSVPAPADETARPESDTALTEYATALATEERALAEREAASVQASPREWSSTHRRVSASMLAGAAIALVIGTGIGYMAGKGMEPTAAAIIQSFEGGLKLRLDSDLRQR